MTITKEEYGMYLAALPIVAKVADACGAHVGNFYQALLGTSFDWWDSIEEGQSIDWSDAEISVQVHCCGKEDQFIKDLCKYSTILDFFPNRYLFISAEDAIADCLAEVEAKKALALEKKQKEKERAKAHKEEKEALRIQALKKLSKEERRALGFKK